MEAALSGFWEAVLSMATLLEYCVFGRLHFDCSLMGGYAFDSSLLGGCAFGGWAFGRLRFHEACGSNEEKSALVDST